jgi:tetratricopeptide (TPR) repeat protein
MTTPSNQRAQLRHPEARRWRDHVSVITQLSVEQNAGIQFFVLLPLCLCVFFMGAAGAQSSSDAITPAPAFNGLPNVLDNLHEGSELHILLVTENKTRLDRQAVVKLHCDYPEGTVFQTTRRDSETIFFDLRFGKYDLDVSAVGYLTEHQTLQVTGLKEKIDLKVIMHRDPMAVSFDAAGSPNALMSTRASKETQRGVRALKSGDLKEANKHLQAAYKLVPSNSRVNFLFGYQYYQQKKFDQAETYLTQSAALDPQNAQALALLGRVEMLRDHFDEASSTLERAIAVDPENWLSHTLLADAYLKQKQYEKAQEQARAALDKGQGAAAPAQLLLGEAQADLGHTGAAIQSLQQYLMSKPDKSTAEQVKKLIAELEHSTAESVAGVPPTLTAPSLASGVEQLRAPEPEMFYDWQPLGIDQSKPPVAAGVTCPSAQVLERTGANVQTLVENVGRFAAVEDMLHERLDRQGNTHRRETRKFDYAANISESKPGYLMLDEYRTERYGVASLPDEIVTSGFPAMALIFHPIMQGNYEMFCEGLGEWQGQATWLVHYRQRNDRPSRIQSFKVGGMSYPVNLKGRAWVSADQFQIVRLESELVNPMPQIQFMAQHSITEYGSIHFQRKNLDIWLPKSADVYLDLHRRLYHRRHSFNHYMLFSVDSEQKVPSTKRNHQGPG